MQKSLWSRNSLFFSQLKAKSSSEYVSKQVSEELLSNSIWLITQKPY